MQGRAASAPLAVCVGEPAAVATLAEAGHLPEGLLAALLPGPVTLLLSRRADAPLCAELNPGVVTVGARKKMGPGFRVLWPHAQARNSVERPM